MTLDVSQAPLWIGVYVAAAIAIYAVGRHEVGRVEEIADRFHTEYAESVHELQQFALREITRGLPTDYPTVKKLISTPQTAPADDAEEAKLRNELDQASLEIQGIGLKLKSVAEPDRLFRSVASGYEDKVRLLNRVLVDGLAASLVLPMVYSLYVVLPTSVAILVSIAIVYAAGFLLAGAGTFRRYRDFQSISDRIKKDRKTLTDEIDAKIHRIRRVELEAPPSTAEGGAGEGSS